MAKTERERAQSYVCQNRKARHDYFIEETYEAGMALKGSEVKSLREGRAHLTDAYALVENGELWLVNSHIGEYAPARENHEARRPRKLLLHKAEIRRLIGKIEEKGMTLIPLAIYFNERGIAKAQVGLGRGKKQHDKREDTAKRDAMREIDRALKGRRFRG
jgi:SsrA-binding protein